MQDTTFTQSLLDRYFDEEKALRERQLSLASLNIHLDANDLAMLNTIAKRFNKSRAELTEELLSSALVDIFTRFEAGERKLIARDADEAARGIANEIAEDNGVKSIELKAAYWAGHDKEAVKAERKRAKQANSTETDSGDNEAAEVAQADLAPTEQAQSDSMAAATSEAVASNDEASAPASMFGN